MSNPYDGKNLPKSFDQKLKREDKIGLNTRFRALRSRQAENAGMEAGAIPSPAAPVPEPMPQAFTTIASNEVTLDKTPGVPSKIVGQEPTSYLRCLSYMRRSVSPTKI